MAIRLKGKEPWNCEYIEPGPFNRNFIVFSVVVAVVWFFSRDILQQLLSFQGSSATIFMPFIGFGLPNFVFFFCVGIVLGFITKENVAKRVGISVCIFCLIQVVFMIGFTRSIAYSWIGILILTAPFIGIVSGLVMGVGAIWIWRRGSPRADSVM